MQALDSTGAPRFITMLGSADRMPVLELRLKSGVDAPSIIDVTLVVLGGGQDMGLNRVNVRFQITITDADDMPPVKQSTEVVNDNEAPLPLPQDDVLLADVL